MKKELKLAILGHGFVGRAVDYGFSHNVEKLIIDPKYGSKYSELEAFNPDIVFVCGPTPSNDNGTIDSRAIFNSFAEARKFCDPLFVLKSTVTPDIVLDLTQKIPHFIYNPEFLTERNANEDFINQSILVLGGDRSVTDRLEKIYRDHTNCRPSPVFHMTALEASFVKYGINSFLSSKVIFFNEYFDLIERYGGSYQKVVSAIGGDPRIGMSHTTVPGFDAKRGFGGACFPKDTSAIVSIAPELTMLRHVVTRNNRYRKQYDLDERETSQNIRFDDSLDEDE